MKAHSAIALAALLLLVLACASCSAQRLPCRDLSAVLASLNSNNRTTYCAQLSHNTTLQHALLPGSSGTLLLFDVQALLPANTAFLGVGLSELGSMKGADMAIICRQPCELSSPSSNSNSNSMGGWQLVDAHARGFVTPEPDAHQDLRLLNLSTRSDSGTGSLLLSATWLRPLAPCDTAEDLPLAVDMPVHALYAHGARWGYHGPNNRGSMLIKVAAAGDAPSANSGGADSGGAASAGAAHTTTTSAASTRGLKQASPAPAPGAATPANSSSNNSSESDVSVLDLVFPTDIPTDETTYRVQYFKLPDDRKYHVIKYAPLVGHKMLHHGVAYACLPSDESKVEVLPHLGPYDRLKQGMLCEQFFMMLASNMTPWQASPVAGLPFGANSTRYVALELHFNNPEGLQGQRDNGSGIRVYYTPKLRKNDVGVLTLGQMVLAIPPGIPNYPTNTSICASGCTARFKQPVNLMQNFFHMHGLGKEIIARHYRTGPDGTSRELTPLGHLRAFDYAYQNVLDIYAPDAKVLLPGDSLSLQCTFDSTSRTNVTLIGPGTRDEMCFVWLTYWPAQADMGYCLSLGNSTVAACGADVKTEDVFAAFRDRARMANLTAAGVLMQFPGDPAVNSTPYAQQCSNLSVT